MRAAVVVEQLLFPVEDSKAGKKTRTGLLERRGAEVHLILD